MHANAGEQKMARHFDHIAAFYRHQASRAPTAFGCWNLTDRAGWYALASNLEG